MNTSHRRPLLKASLLVSLLLVFSFNSLSQELDQAVVAGRIADVNGHPITDASVTLESSAGIHRRNRLTDRTGRFRFEEVPSGTYTLRASADGFAAVATSHFNLTAGDAAVFDLILEVAPFSVTQTVEVDADAVMRMDTTRTVSSSGLGARELLSLPNLKRDPLQMLLFLGGVSEEALSVRDLADDESPSFRTTPLEQGLVAVSGGVTYSNNVTIDGLDNNDDRTSRERFTPPVETVTEVQVIRNQFSAEYGRAAGSRINLVTAAGGGMIRGTASASVRHDKLNANSWRNNSRGIPRPKMRQQRYAGSLGGPLTIPSDLGRIHFMGAFESDRESDDTLIDTFVPAARNNRFPLPDGTDTQVFCESEEPARCEAVSSAAYLRRFTDRFSSPNTGLSLTGRLDHRTQRGIDTTVGLQFGSRRNAKSGAARTTRLREAMSARSSVTHAFNISNSHTFGQGIFNQVRIQHSVLAPAFSANDPEAIVLLIAYRNPLTGMNETLSASNSTAGTLQNFPETRRESRWQINDSMTIASERHTLRSGFDAHSIRSRANAIEDSSGTFNFPSVAAFHSNTLSRFRQNFGTASEIRNRYVGTFLNGEFRISDTFNASIGLRYEVESAVSDRDNFGPRAGLAWDPSGRGLIVLRLGGGLFFNRVLLRTVSDYQRSQSGALAYFDSNLIGASASDVRRGRVLAAIAERFPNGFASADELRKLIAGTDCALAGATPSPCPTSLGFSGIIGSSSTPNRSIDPEIRIPESIQVNAGFETKLGSNLVLEINATLNRTRGLWREVGINLPVLPEGHADWMEFLLANPFSFTNTNGSVRTYEFYLGLPTAGGGVNSAPGGASACPTTVTTRCYVNLNSLGTTVTFPSTATADTSNSAGTALGIASAAIARFRPDQDAGAGEMIVPLGRALYKGLVIELRSPFGRLPLGFRGTSRFSYTLSHSMDDGLNNTSNAEVDSDFSREWSRSLIDRRHRLSFVGVIEAPRLLGRLEFAPGFRYGSSAPFNLGIGSDRNLDGSSTDRPVFSGDQRLVRWRHPSSEIPTSLLAGLTLSPIGAKGGTLPRNAGRGPSMVVMDLSVSRRFEMGAKLKAFPRLEFGNVLNLAVFSFGAEYIDFSALGANPTPSQLSARQGFLVPTRTLRPREVRGSLRLEF